MAFWTDSLAAEPKRNFRFQVTITGFNGKGGNDQSVVWWAKKVTKPNFTIAEGKHVYLGHTFYYPGKVEWQEISMTLVDPVTPNGGAILMDLVQKAGYILPTATNDSPLTLSKGKFGEESSGFGSFVIDQINSEGESIEKWTLHGPFIKSLKFGDLDYENEDLSNIEMGIRYDWAECDTGDSGSPFFETP